MTRSALRAAHSGSSTWTDVSDASQPHEANILRLAIDKALWKLDWRPCWDLDETLRRTAQWFRRYHEAPDSMRQLSLEQIGAYETALAETSRDEGALCPIPDAGPPRA